jgi:hypothetical protein
MFLIVLMAYCDEFGQDVHGGDVQKRAAREEEDHTGPTTRRGRTGVAELKYVFLA